MKPAYALAAALLLTPLAPAPLAKAQQPTLHTSPDAPALPNQPHHEANFDAETQQADALFTAGKQLDALPLYEDLCRQDPTVALFAERHGVTLFTRYATPGTDPKDQLNAFVQALNELHRAQSLGDNSNQLRSMITVAEKTPLGSIITGIPLTAGYTYMGSPAAQATMKQAEVAFAAKKGDEAARLYVAAATQDPAFYTAALFAGDAYFTLKDFTNGATWFAKAIAIDPDRETAYRYWADSIYRAGNPAGAKEMVVKAYIAEPYSVATWNELRNWASATKTPLVIPGVNRQEYRTRDGRIALTATPETGDGRASWYVYQQVRVSHGATSLTQNTPPGGSTMANGDFVPTGYIHTLAEEMDALTALLADIDKKLAAGTITPDRLDPTFKVLQQLRKDNMLECFILLNSPDLGLRHDYPKYRATHRDQLIAYVNRYLLTAPTQ